MMAKVKKQKPASTPPETYDVTIIVEGGGVSLETKMPGIKRSDIMAPGYGSQGTTAAVRVLESMVWGEDV